MMFLEYQNVSAGFIAIPVALLGKEFIIIKVSVVLYFVLQLSPQYP